LVVFLALGARFVANFAESAVVEHRAYDVSELVVGGYVSGAAVSGIARQLEALIGRTDGVESFHCAGGRDGESPKVLFSVEGTRAAHRRLAPELERLKRLRQQKIQTRFEFISLPRDRLHELELDQLGSPAATSPGAGTLLSEAQLAKLETFRVDLLRERAAVRLSILTVMSLNHGECTVAQGDWFDYATGWQKHTDARTGAITWTPKTKHFHDGVSCRIVATVGLDRENITLELEPKVTCLLKHETLPYEEAPPEAELFVHRLRSKMLHWTTRATVPAKGTFLMVLGDDPDPKNEGRTVILLAQPKLVP